MALAELLITNLRCIESAALEISPELNLIAGPNGSGKTSILEAIFLLGRGRSFRTRNSERLIRHGQSALTVFGRGDGLSPQSAGVEVTRDGGTRARLNGGNAESMLALSSAFPVQAIDPEIHKLVDQGPERRRRWLDWLVFHVEPTFGSHWARYQRALRQRNAALKAPGSNFATWNAALVEHGAAMDTARRATLLRLHPYLEALLLQFSGLDLGVGFHSGWSQEQSLAEALSSSEGRDRERATTTVGAHRADIVLRTKGGRSARETLSRGQQKIAAVAMIVAQLKLLRVELDVRATLLLDDPAAELDARNLNLLFGELAELNCQMIATSLSPEIALFQAPKAMFHVEQGRVLQV